jgi:hypothetical protein
MCTLKKNFLKSPEAIIVVSRAVSYLIIVIPIVVYVILGRPDPSLWVSPVLIATVIMGVAAVRFTKLTRDLWEDISVPQDKYIAHLSNVTTERLSDSSYTKIAFFCGFMLYYSMMIRYHLSGSFVHYAPFFSLIILYSVGSYQAVQPIRGLLNIVEKMDSRIKKLNNGK